MMGHFRLQGRLSRLGQCEFDNERTVYAFIEVIESDGKRVLVKNAIVFTDIASGLYEGMAGEFYFDELFVCGRKIRSQLWGFTTAERRVIDSVNFRNVVTRANLVFGVLFTPVLALGSAHLVAGLCQFFILFTGSTNRGRFLRSLDASPTAPSAGTFPERAGDVLRSAAPHTFRTSVSLHDDLIRK